MSATILQFPDRRQEKGVRDQHTPSTCAYTEERILEMLREIAANLGLAPLHAEKANTAAEEAKVTACFIDTMRPVTPAEMSAWKFYLSLPSRNWPAARNVFRRAHNGDALAVNILQFVTDTGITDAAVLDDLERVLKALASE